MWRSKCKALEPGYMRSGLDPWCGLALKVCDKQAGKPSQLVRENFRKKSNNVPRKIVKIKKNKKIKKNDDSYLKTKAKGNGKPASQAGLATMEHFPDISNQHVPDL